MEEESVEKEAEIRKMVREGYAKVATRESSCCPPVISCCGGGTDLPVISCCGGGTDLPVMEDISKMSKMIGYSEEELKEVPEGSNLGLGCGNPVALASLQEGETVLDLGSGAGFDCFLAANRVGENGKIIGVDMTPEMIDKARENARKNNYENVEFRLGEIENLPAADDSVDVVISNCVINLSPNKGKVFQETFRVLKPGGRLMISDIVLEKELPDFIKNSINAYIACISGAILREEYIGAIKAAGFQDVKIIGETLFPAEFVTNDPTVKKFVEELNIPLETVKDVIGSAVSVKVTGIKPNKTA